MLEITDVGMGSQGLQCLTEGLAMCPNLVSLSLTGSVSGGDFLELFRGGKAFIATLARLRQLHVLCLNLTNTPVLFGALFQDLASVLPQLPHLLPFRSSGVTQIILCICI